jgi:hypothetical protein
MVYGAIFPWQADGFAAKERVGIRADHRGLLCDENVLELLKKWLGASKKTRHRVSKSRERSPDQVLL